MKAVIVEDEPLVARDLTKLLAQVAPDLEIVTKLGSVEDAVQWFAHNPQPDLVFMDVQLSDGVSFSIFDQTRIEVPVIFTTAYNEYAIRAFKVNSIDYLLKPIDREDLMRSMDKFKHLRELQNGSQSQSQSVEELVKLLKSPVTETPRYKERFMVQYRNSMMPVASNKVSYFVKDELIYLVTEDQQRYICEYETMDELEQLLDPKTFFRANRQYIIRLEAVESFKSGFNGKLVVKLKGGASTPEIDISREKATLFKAWLD